MCYFCICNIVYLYFKFCVSSVHYFDVLSIFFVIIIDLIWRMTLCINVTIVVIFIVQYFFFVLPLQSVYNKKCATVLIWKLIYKFSVYKKLWVLEIMIHENINVIGKKKFYDKWMLTAKYAQAQRNMSFYVPLCMDALHTQAYKHIQCTHIHIQTHWCIDRWMSLHVMLLIFFHFFCRDVSLY